MGNRSQKYDDESKKSLVSMYENGKTQSHLAREYITVLITNIFTISLLLELLKIRL